MPQRESDIETLGEAYLQLVERQKQVVWGLCVRHARGDWDRAADLVQEVWSLLWRYMGALPAGLTVSQERRWVTFRTRGILYRLRRRELRRVESPGGFPDVAVEAEASDERLGLLLERLSPDERRMVQYYLDGYDYDALAALFGTSVLAMRKRMSRLVRRMRQMAQEMGIE